VLDGLAPRRANEEGRDHAPTLALPVEPIGDHPVPAGPLAVRWLEWSLPAFEAGAPAHVDVRLENAGLAPWHELNLAYHWLDERGNPIVWDGMRTPLPDVAPGERTTVTARVRGPIPPGSYRFALDLVAEFRYWLAEVGSHAPEREVEVAPRDASAARAFLGDAEPDDGWHALVRAAHEQGYAAVGGSIAPEGGLFRRADPELEPYAPGGGRNPSFAHPLVCPSLLPPLEPNAEVAGLPAWRPEGDEPWIYDARATVRLRSRSRRRRA
jgi:hypothetical protein